MNIHITPILFFAKIPIHMYTGFQKGIMKLILLFILFLYEFVSEVVGVEFPGT